MKKIKFFVLLAVVVLFTACHDKLWDSIEDLDSRVTKLEELCKEMNTNISALQTIVSVIQENDFITGIVPIEKGGEVIGYTIMFGKHEPITIYNGEDGKDGQNGSGSTPIIGVAKDTDGVYYWTLNGEWLLDDEGNKLPVSGKNGNDGVDGEDSDGESGTAGKDGVTPQLKIENGYWYVSYDNGATWTELGKAIGEDGEKGDKGDKGDTGNDGDSMFTSVTYDDNNVYFTLKDGSVLIVPRGDNSTSDFDQTVIDNLVNSLKLDKDTISLNIGEKTIITATTAPFSNSKVIWCSSDETIVKVENGVVEAISYGTVIISAKAGTLVKECYVFVSKALGLGNEYVDLGLSVKWATCNVGANSPEGYGDYFAWGEIDPKSAYNISTYKYSGLSLSILIKYCNTDNKKVLEPGDDAATMNWGGAWRLPTKEEQDELRSNCIWTWTTQNGVIGYKVIGSNGNSIFLPAAGYMNEDTPTYAGSYGYYLSSSLCIDSPNYAYFVYFDLGRVLLSRDLRYSGLSVRPVIE